MDEITRNAPVIKFEKTIAKFFGAPYGVATDCCTNALELCFRLDQQQRGKAVVIAKVPFYTYHSIPIMLDKIGQAWKFEDNKWEGYYNLTPDIIDAAVYWKENSYVPGNFMCLSFQFRKHLNLGRGGMILTDDKEAARELKLMSYDGREQDVPWATQNISRMGYHYYMTPEIAQLGLDKFDEAVTTKPRQWVLSDWPDLSQMEIFK